MSKVYECPMCGCSAIVVCPVCGYVCEDCFEADSYGASSSGEGSCVAYNTMKEDLRKLKESKCRLSCSKWVLPENTDQRNGVVDCDVKEEFTRSQLARKIESAERVRDIVHDLSKYF